MVLKVIYIGAAVIILASHAGVCDPPKPAVRYTVTDLGVLPGYPYTHPKAINDHGEVTGNLQETEQRTVPFIWDAKHGLRIIETEDKTDSHALGNNNLGQAVGRAGGHPFLSLKDGGVSDFLKRSGQAWDISDNDQITGRYYDTDGQFHAFRWGKTDGMEELTAPGEFTRSCGVAINNRGDIAGFLEKDPDHIRHAFLWSGDKTTDLGTLGWEMSEAHGINNHGQVVGVSHLRSDCFHAFLWQNGKMTDLGVEENLPKPAGFVPTSEALAINDKGIIVGTENIGFGGMVACMWENGKVVNLNSLIPADSSWSLTLAEGINSQGQIVGWGVHHTKEPGKIASYGFLLTPIANSKQPAKALKWQGKPLHKLKAKKKAKRAG